VKKEAKKGVFHRFLLPEFYFEFDTVVGGISKFQMGFRCMPSISCNYPAGDIIIVDTFG